MNQMAGVKDVMKAMDVAESTAYKIIKDLNAELKKKGFMTLTGRVPKAYFESRFYGIKLEISERRNEA